MLKIAKYAVSAPQSFFCRLQSNSSRALSTKAATKNVPVEDKPHQPEAQQQPKDQNKVSQSFAANLYCGNLEMKQVFPFPSPLTEDQLDTVKMLVDPVEKFFEEVNDAERNDTNETVDQKTMAALWELGAFCFQVPQEYGGLGLTNTQYSRCVEICGYHDLGIGILLGAHQSIGFKGLLLYGTPEQKAKYLPRVCNGDLAAFCLTEPTAGSDAASIRCRAVKSADGSHYVLNGSKIWISNGGIAEILTVFAQTPVEDPVTGKTKDKVSAFIVERAFGGVTSGPSEKKMGIRCSNTSEIFFDDVKIPVENLLSKEGEGFKVAMNILNNGRFGMAAALSGTMKYCIKQAVNHATQRRQFGKTIDNYGTIQAKIGRMGVLQYVTESLAYTISGNMDMGSEDYHIEAAISKCFAAESAWWVCDEAIQTLGGMGFMKSGGLERVQRDLRIFRIFEGTNDILRLFVALSGLQYAGVQLELALKALKNPAVNFTTLVSEMGKRASRIFAVGTFSALVHPSLKEEEKVISALVNKFGTIVEMCLRKHKRGIVDEQYLLHSLAQATFDLYTMTVVLSRATSSANNNLPTAEQELIMAKAWCSEASERVIQNLMVVNTDRFNQQTNRLSKISRDMCDAGGCIQHSPLGF